MKEGKDKSNKEKNRKAVNLSSVDLLELMTESKKWKSDRTLRKDTIFCKTIPSIWN